MSTDTHRPFLGVAEHDVAIGGLERYAEVHVSPGWDDPERQNTDVATDDISIRREPIVLRVDAVALDTQLFLHDSSWS